MRRDLTGLCGRWGRIAADQDANRVFLNLLGRTYAIDFAAGVEPVVSAPIPTGLAADIRVEGDMLYVNGVGGRTRLFVKRDGAWIPAGGHDVRKWAEGTVETGAFSLWGRPGRLIVGTRQ